MFIPLFIIFLFFVFIIIYMRKQHEQMIIDVFSLTDLDKKYIKILMRNGRINLSEQSEKDRDTLQKLDDSGWIFPLDDGAFIRGESTDGLLRVLDKSSYQHGMSDNQTTAFAAVITIIILALFGSISNFDIQKHWVVLVLLAPVAFFGAKELIESDCRAGKEGSIFSICVRGAVP